MSPKAAHPLQKSEVVLAERHVVKGEAMLCPQEGV